VVSWFFISMRKSALAAQLRVHFAKQGYPLEEMFKRSDDTVIGMIAGRYDWCGETHIYGEKLDQLIAVSVDEKHFRGLWNDSNNIECLGC
jgi:hypothetical protein